MSNPLTKLVILDRDGVINQHSEQCIRSAEAWQPIPGSLPAIARLNQAGYRVAVATNQPAIAQGLIDLDTLNAIHQKMHDHLDRIGGHIDVIAFCPHEDEHHCDCRKPLPGMYRQIADRMGAELARTIVIGDSLRDLVATIAVNARPILVRTGKGMLTEPQLDDLDVDIDVYDDLAHAVSTLLMEES